MYCASVTAFDSVDEPNDQADAVEKHHEPPNIGPLADGRGFCATVVVPGGLDSPIVTYASIFHARIPDKSL